MLGHPVHPALVHFPIACWSLAVIADYGAIWLGETSWRWSMGLLVIGCSMGIFSMLAGLMELHKVREGEALKDTYVHMVLMFGAFICFSLSLLLRFDGVRGLAPNTLTLSLGTVGLGCLIIGSWFGGRLVYRYGVGRNNQNQAKP